MKRFIHLLLALCLVFQSPGVLGSGNRRDIEHLGRQVNRLENKVDTLPNRIAPPKDYTGILTLLGVGAVVLFIYGVGLGSSARKQAIQAANQTIQARLNHERKLLPAHTPGKRRADQNRRHRKKKAKQPWQVHAGRANGFRSQTKSGGVYRAWKQDENGHIIRCFEAWQSNPCNSKQLPGPPSD